MSEPYVLAGEDGTVLMVSASNDEVVVTVVDARTQMASSAALVGGAAELVAVALLTASQEVGR